MVGTYGVNAYFGSLLLVPVNTDFRIHCDLIQFHLYQEEEKYLVLIV